MDAPKTNQAEKAPAGGHSIKEAATTFAERFKEVTFEDLDQNQWRKALDVRPMDLEEVVAGLDKLVLLSRDNKDVAKTLNRLVYLGTPLLKINLATTEATGDGVMSYQLSEEVRALLAAVRAVNPYTDKAVSGSGHKLSPT